MNTFLLYIPLILFLTLTIAIGFAVFTAKNIEMKSIWITYFITCVILSFFVAAITNSVYINNNTKHGIYMKCVNQYTNYEDVKTSTYKDTIHANCESLIKSI